MLKPLRGDRLVKAMGWLMVIVGTSALVIASAVLSVLIVSQRATAAAIFVWLTWGLVSVAVITAGARVLGTERWRGRVGVALSVAAYMTLPLFPAFFLAIRAPEFVISPVGSNVAWAMIPLAVVVVPGLTIGRYLINAQRKRGPFLQRPGSTTPAKIAARTNSKETHSRYRLG